MNPRRGRRRTSVDVFVTVPAGIRPHAPACPADLERLECLSRHRVEWCAAKPGPADTDTWHFRAPDAESVRIALRHAGVEFESVRVVHPD